MELQYAPQSKSRNRVWTVWPPDWSLRSGSGRSVFSPRVRTHQRDGVPRPLHYSDWRRVGRLVASSGYGLASLKTGLRIRPTLLWTILLFQFFAYFGAEDCEFASRGSTVLPGTTRPASFLEAFCFNATNTRWRQSGPGPDSEPMGELGYFVVGIEILGFMLGKSPRGKPLATSVL